MTAFLQIEIANFTKNTFKYIPWEEIRTIKNIDNYGISSIISKKMAKANVLMAVSDDAQTMALLYKGEAIAVGNGKSIKETLKNIFTFARKEKDIAKHLDELLEATVFVKKIAHLFKTKADEAFFWSGRTDGIGGQEIALEIALSKNGITLEGLNSSRNLGLPIWEEKPRYWEIASREYAMRVSGNIKAVIGKILRENNVWENFELPVLKTNPNVKSITIIDPKTKTEKLIFKR